MTQIEETKTVTIRSFSTVAEAEVMRGLLTGAGIDCFIANRASAGLFPGNPINFAQIDVIVRESDLELAEKILAASFDESELSNNV